MKKRLISMALVLVMVLGLLPISALAVDIENFTDLKTDAWYYDYIDYVVEKEYFIGMSETEFQPKTEMTRAMFVTVIARIEGAKINNDVESSFPDAKGHVWYTGSIEWAAENGIVEGYEDGTFRPHGNVTRQEMCTIMDRYIEWRCERTGEEHVTDGEDIVFTDAADIAPYAEEYVQNCVTYGLVEGYPDGSFLPRNNSTRAEVATVVCRLDWIVHEDDPVYPPYNPTKFTLTVNYLDADTNAAIAAAATEKILAGNAYDASAYQKTIAGYTFKEATGDAISGIMNGPKTVNYLYTKDPTYTDYIYEGVSGMAADVADLAKSYVVKANDLSNEYKAYIASLDELVGDIDLGEYVSAGYTIGDIANNERPVTIEAGIELNQETANNIVKIAAGAAAVILGDENFATWDEVKAVVDAVKEDLALFGLSPISELDAAKITELVYNYIQSKSGIWTDNFKGANGYYTGDISVECGDFTGLIKVDDNGVSAENKKQQLVDFAIALAKQIYADVKAKAPDYVHEMSDIEALIDVTFSAGAYKADTDNFPYAYPVTLNLDVVNDVEAVQYKFDGYNHIKLVINKQAQADIQAAATKIKNSEYVQNLISEVVEAVVSGDPIEFNYAGSGSGEAEATIPVDQIVDILTKYGRTATGEPMSEAQAETLVGDYLTLWVETNIGNGTDSENWDNTAIYNLVNVVADQVFEGVNEELDKHGLALSKNVTPEQLEENIKKAGVNIDVNEGVKNYVIAVICDEARGEVYYSSENGYENAAGEIVNPYQGMSSYINETVDNTVAENPEFEKAMEYAEKIYAVLDDMSKLVDVRLGNLATALRIETMQDYVASKGDESYVAKVCAYLEKVPASASVTIGDAQIDKADLAALADAETVAEACNALADIIETTGLAELTIGSFAPEAGQDISVSYKGKPAVANLVIEIQ